MFKNSGKKIMGFVNFVFYLNLVLALLAAVGGTVYVHMEYEELTYTLLAAVVALAAVLLYMLLVFLSLLSLYAFGELTQSNVEIKQLLQQLVDRGREEPESGAAAHAAPAAPAPTPRSPMLEKRYPVTPYVPEEPVRTPPAREPAPVQTAAAPAPVQTVAAPAQPAIVFCPKCGGKHSPTATHCRYCATPLQN